jgi:hypothetical protein
MPRKPLPNLFSYSNSRGRKLDDCARAYWWSYYGSWGGWEESAPPETRLAYRLKKLQSRHAWAGDVAHGRVAEAMKLIRSGRPVDAARDVELARRDMREEWVRSNRGQRHGANQRGFWGLQEHEYGDDVDKTEWEANWERCRSSLEWWHASKYPALARETVASWLALDSTDPSEKIPTFRLPELGGVRMIAEPDWTFRRGDRVVVVDYKTGKPKPADWDQVYGYAFFLRERHHVPLASIDVELAYLRTGEVSARAVDAAGAGMFLESVRGQLARMASFLEPGEDLPGADPQQEAFALNRPRAMEAFPMTQDREQCARCEFRKLCWKADP